MARSGTWCLVVAACMLGGVPPAQLTDQTPGRGAGERAREELVSLPVWLSGFNFLLRQRPCYRLPVWSDFVLDAQACAAWHGERTYAVDLDTIDTFVVLDFPRTLPEVRAALPFHHAIGPCQCIPLPVYTPPAALDVLNV